jgi:hypothetical protein
MMKQRVIVLKDHEKLHRTGGVAHVPPSIARGHHGAEFPVEGANFGVGGSGFGAKGGKIVWCQAVIIVKLRNGFEQM